MEKHVSCLRKINIKDKNVGPSVGAVGFVSCLPWQIIITNILLL